MQVFGHTFSASRLHVPLLSFPVHILVKDKPLRSEISARADSAATESMAIAMQRRGSVRAS
jgi:hypothetical protein